MVGVDISSVPVFHRFKRQTHPSSTLARLPPDPFAPLTQHIFAQFEEPLFNDRTKTRNGRQLGSSRPIQNPGPSVGKWELGYNAGDILSPPGFDSLQAEESRYRTINVINRPNFRPEHFTPSDTDSSATVIWGTLKPGSTINHPLADSPSQFNSGSDQFKPIIPAPHYDDYNTQPSSRSNYKSQPNYRAQPERNTYSDQRQINYDDEDESEDASEVRSNEDHRNEAPVVRPVYTYVKTDKRGHFKWGVHHGAVHGR